VGIAGFIWHSGFFYDFTCCLTNVLAILRLLIDAIGSSQLVNNQQMAQTPDIHKKHTKSKKIQEYHHVWSNNTIF